MSEERKDIPETTEKEDKSSYRSIFKAISLFGGVQLWKILITIVQTKFVAVILGPSGMGIKGLYSSATALIQSITSMGLANSAVRDVSEAHGTGNAARVSRTVAVLRRLVWFTGLLGMVTVIVLSPVLSKTTFGDYSYTIPFVLLSVSLLLAQLTVGQNVLLQGTRHYSYLAKASFIGSIASLVITVPLYYLWGTKGIVPTIILESVSLFLLAYYFAKKVKIEKTDIAIKEALKEGKGMMGLGLVMTYNAVLVTAVSYILRVVITRIGGIGDVGLYNAGFAVESTYTGLVFSAMTTDYYPRLAAANQDNQKCRSIINQQIEISILIMGPLMAFFLLVAPVAIIAIYSEKFLPIIGFLQWAALGIVLRAIGWAISYQFVAKSDKRAYAINETAIHLIGLPLNIIGYKYYGITGLGISAFINRFIYILIVYSTAHKKYNFSFSKEVLRVISIFSTCLLSIFLLLVFWQSYWSFVPASILFLLGCWYAYIELDKRLGIKQIWVNFKNRRK